MKRLVSLFHRIACTVPKARSLGDYIITGVFINCKWPRPSSGLHEASATGRAGNLRGDEAPGKANRVYPAPPPLRPLLFAREVHLWKRGSHRRARAVLYLTEQRGATEEPGVEKTGRFPSEGVRSGVPAGT